MSLGQIKVSLGLDAAEFTQGLTKAEYQARKLGQEMGEQIRAGALLAAGAMTALGVASKEAFDFIKNQTDAIDAFNDLSDATGASIENISALDRVARETGGTFETAEAVLLKFNKALADAKPDNDAGRLMKALNLDIAQLKSLDPAEALRQTAVAFARFESDGNKARAMQELFGKSVKEAAPFLNDLAEQTALVGTTSTATAQQAETFNKQLSALQANATDASRAIVADLLPSLSRALANFAELRKQGNLGLIVKDAALDVIGLGKLTGNNGADINKFIKQRDALQAAMEKEARPLVRANDPRKNEIAELNRYLEVARAKQRNEIAALYSGDYADAISRKFDKPMSLPNFAKADTPKAGGGGKSAKIKDPTAEAQRYIESLQKQLERAQDLTVQEQVLRDLQMDRLGQVTSAQKDELLGIAGQIDAAKALTDQRKLDLKAMEDQKQMQKDLMDEGARLFEQVRSPLEAFNAAQDNLNKLLEAGAIDFVTAARAGELYKKTLDESTKTLNQMDEFAKNAAESIQQSIGDGLVNIMEGNFKDIGTNFGKMLTRMAADALAADLARKLFGASVKGGEGEGWLGALLKGVGGMAFGGGKATGGAVSPGMFYEVNERGPELLDVNGKQFLMMGNNRGNVVPNSAFSGGAGANMRPIINNFTVQGSVDRSTQQQIAKRAGDAIRIASARQG